MDNVEIVVPIKIDSRLSLNSIYSGIHWGKRKKQAQKIHNLINLELMNQGIPKELFKNPVQIKFYWNSLLDLDNHGLIAKLIIDGLKGYLIYDDSKKYIEKITHKYWRENGVKIIISDKPF